MLVDDAGDRRAEDRVVVLDRVGRARLRTAWLTASTESSPRIMPKSGSTSTPAPTLTIGISPACMLLTTVPPQASAQEG